MSRRARPLSVAALVVLGSLIVITGSAPAGTARTIFMSAVEYKGGTNIADEAFPPAETAGTEALAPLGGGYRLKEPDANGRWEVESYRFEPGAFAVRKGDQVQLEIAGINGARHDARLVSPKGVEVPVVITRGRLTRVSFKAKPGTWRLVCDTHPPGMVAEIEVLS